MYLLGISDMLGLLNKMYIGEWRSVGHGKLNYLF